MRHHAALLRARARADTEYFVESGEFFGRTVSQAYGCSGVKEGDLAWDGAEGNLDLGDITGFTGSVAVTNVSSVEALRGLTAIGGDLTITGCASLPDLDALAALTSLDGTLNLYDNAALASLDGLFENLVSVGGDLLVHDNAALTELASTSLAEVGGHVYIGRNGALARVALSALTEVRGEGRLDSAETPLRAAASWESKNGNGIRAGGILVEGNSNLATLAFTALRSIPSSIYISLGNPELSSIDFLALVSIGGDFRMDETNITELLFPSLESTGRNFEVKYHKKLSRVELPELVFADSG